MHAPSSPRRPTSPVTDPLRGQHPSSSPTQERRPLKTSDLGTVGHKEGGDVGRFPPPTWSRQRPPRPLLGGSGKRPCLARSAGRYFWDLPRCSDVTCVGCTGRQSLSPQTRQDVARGHRRHPSRPPGPGSCAEQTHRGRRASLCACGPGRGRSASSRKAPPTHRWCGAVDDRVLEGPVRCGRTADALPQPDPYPVKRRATSSRRLPRLAGRRIRFTEAIGSGGVP